MDLLEGLFFVSSLAPLAAAWRANRGTTLTHALAWTTAAWLAWGALQPLVQASGAAPVSLSYLALCLASCAGVAVLGARSPIVGAWNFVLLGLLAVLLLPWAENMLLGTPLLDRLRLVFIVATLAVGVLNYLPTRLAMPALVLAAGCGAELLLLTDGEPGQETRAWLAHVSRLAVPSACWLGWRLVRRRGAATEFDRRWLAFRDRFGLLWGQRLREQFNRAAANAAWPARLHWTGLRGGPATPEMLDTLGAMLKRFGL
jgi:hypothetical protein